MLDSNSVKIFHRLIQDYCKTKGVEREKFSFVINEKEFFEHDTPRSFGMNNGDEFDVVKR